MLKFAWNFIAMFVFVFVSLSTVMCALWGLFWAAMNLGGDYAVPFLLLAMMSSMWGVSYAMSERRK